MTMRTSFVTTHFSGTKSPSIFARSAASENASAFVEAIRSSLNDVKSGFAIRSSLV